jgi:hypothetical protein
MRSDFCQGSQLFPYLCLSNKIVFEARLSGVYIIAHCVDEVRYVRDAQGENSVYFVKKRSTR